MNNGKIFLIRTAVKHRRGANNEKIILIHTAAVRIAFSMILMVSLYFSTSQLGKPWRKEYVAKLQNKPTE